MYSDSHFKAEVLSSLLGHNIKPHHQERCGTTADILSVHEFHLLHVIGKGKEYREEFFIKEEEFFDPQYDYDFTNLSDSTECKRGDELYERPKGWYRMALKVKGIYPDGGTWLGPDGWRSYSVPGEWPVSFHGTSLEGAKGIISDHYKPGSREVYGRGIYSTPNIQEAKHYVKSFTSKITGKCYEVILQNRINPQKRKICEYAEYWLIPVPKGKSDEEETEIVHSSIRPYSILIKEL